MSRSRLPAFAVIGLLLESTLGEGGAAPLALSVIHAVVVALLLAFAVFSGPASAPVGGLAGGPLGSWCVFLAMAAAAAVASPYRYAAFLTLVELATFLAVASLAARCGPTIISAAAAVLLWGGAAQGILALYQSVVARQDRPPGSFLNPNHLGGWLVAVVVLGLVGWDRTPSRTALAVRGAAASAAALGVFLCGSRGALVGLAAAGLALAPAAWRGFRGSGRRWLLAAGAAVLLVAAVWGVVVRLARGSDPFLYNRLRIWRASLSLAWEFPWTGSGPGQFAAHAANLNFPLEGGPLRYERFFVSPHSQILGVPCEFGWPATLACLGVLVVSAAEIRRRIRARELPPSATGAAAALVGLGAQALVDDLGDRPAIYLLAAVLLGGCLSTPTQRRPSAGFRLASLALVTSLFVTMDVAPLLALADVAPSRVWGTRHAAGDLPRGRLDSRGRARLESSLSRNPFHPDTWLRRAEDLAGDGSDWDLPSYARAREAAERAIRLNPTDAHYRLGLARIERLACLTLFGDEASRARAARAYGEAQDRARHDPFVALEEGRFLLAAGDPSGARRAAERVLAIEPEAVPGRLLLADAVLSAGGESSSARARRISEEAARVAERWAQVPRQTLYARRILDLDAVWQSSLRARIEAAHTPP